VPPVTRSKYHAIPTTVDGIRFASKAEAKRYGELRILERAGHIEGLECQPVFVLHARSSTGQAVEAIKALAGTRETAVGKYRGDFAYLDYKRGRIVEDVKGMDTPLSKWKRKHVAIQYGITVEIVR